MIAIGVDLSLTATGVAIVDSDDSQNNRFELVTSKPNGSTPTDEVARLRGILAEIIALMEGVEPDLVALEGLAFMARNSTALVQLAGLNYLLRMHLYDRDIPFIVVAPTSLKKFVTGAGNAQKDHMMLEIYKQYGETFLDNNLADAFALSALSLALLDAPLKETTVKQKEVLSLIEKQEWTKTNKKASA